MARTTPLFSNFLFTNLFSIKFLYFFIISSLLPYFNLFVSIFIQSYVNINCTCRPYIDTILYCNIYIRIDPWCPLHLNNYCNCSCAWGTSRTHLFIFMIVHVMTCVTLLNYSRFTYLAY